ncbi:MAG: DUF4332 domain-containing protein [Gemmatimonadota bacterium]|nr:MAG: DUF4332 domain-containing protein [Gemmatimonadota bacterium]
MGLTDRQALAARLAVLALLVLAAATAGAVTGMEPFHRWYYHWAWYPFLIALGAGYALRTASSPLSARLAASLFFWSAPLWFLFELFNLRLANWYYVFAADTGPVRALAAFTAFATVLPAIYLAYRWVRLAGFAQGLRGPVLPLRRYPGALAGAGFAFLALSLWQPRIFFPLVWGGLTLVLEPWNYRRAPERSLVGDLAVGRYDRLAQLALAGALVGLCWEAFNALAATRWIYTVPGLEGHKLFEMPLPGFLGFPVFALDCFVGYQALVNLRVAEPGWGGAAPSRWNEGRGDGRAATRRPPVGRIRLLAGGGAAIALGIAVTAGMERWTIDSTHPELESLPTASETEIRALRAAGIRSVDALAHADPAALAGQEAAGLDLGPARRLVAMAGLTMLRGLGTENAAALRSAGIASICELAGAEPAAVSAAVRAARSDPRAGSPPRVRVWLRSARRACPEPGPGDAARAR